MGTWSRAPGKLPVPWSNELAADVCERIAAGDLLSDVCEEPGAPTWGQWWHWLETQPALAEAYARARRLQAHSFAERLIKIPKAEDVNPQLARIESDNLKWLASRLNPRELGDNLQVRHADADGQKLDTGPRVAELLALMQPGAITQAPAAPIDVTPRVIAPLRVEDVRVSDSDVSDLV